MTPERCDCCGHRKHDTKSYGRHGILCYECFSTEFCTDVEAHENAHNQKELNCELCGTKEASLSIVEQAVVFNLCGECSRKF